MDEDLCTLHIQHHNTQNDLRNPKLLQSQVCAYRHNNPCTNPVHEAFQSVERVLHNSMNKLTHPLKQDYIFDDTVTEKLQDYIFDDTVFEKLQEYLEELAPNLLVMLL